MARYVNFWTDFSESWCPPFFAPLAKTQLTIGSLFGHSPEPVDLLFSAECAASLRHDGTHFLWESLQWTNRSETDRAFWFFGIPGIDHPRALHVPLYFIYWDPSRTRPASQTREPGISFIASNVTIGPLAKRRLEIAIALSRWFPVHAPEKLRPHFPPDTTVHFHDIPDKLAFVERYEYSLCFENRAHPGYLTEKLFHALAAGAVPLYEGDPDAGKWFREGSYIDCAGLDAESIAAKIEATRKDGAMAHLVDTEREKLSLISYEEMQTRFTDFVKAVTADRDHLLHRGRKWVRRKLRV